MSREMIEDRFLVGAIIGKGSFGKVFETKDKITGKKFAIKFMEHESAQVHLKNEYEVINGINIIWNKKFKNSLSSHLTGL